MSLKRNLFLTHRWLGVILSVLFVLWFFSGIVMMYVGFPATDHDRRIAGQAALAVPAGCCAELTHAFEAHQRPRLRMAGGQVHVGLDGNWFSLAGGHALSAIDRRQAAGMAAEALSRRGEVATIVSSDTRYNDQWTVPQRYHAHRPLHHLVLDDGRHLHVSSQTGEIVLETSRAERGWNWVGSIIHWLYFTRIREHPRFWAELVIWLSVAGTLLAMVGMWGGIKQLRLKRRHRGKSVIPYRGWAAWHQATGLLFGFFIITFIISGLLSLTPWGLFDREGVTPAERLALHGSPSELDARTMAGALETALSQSGDRPIREMEFLAIGGQWWARLRDGEEDQFLQVGGEQLRDTIPADLLETVADRLSEARIENDRTWISEPDFYYYGNRRQPNFPVLRLRLEDGVAPWYYLDPRSGGLARKVDRSGRAYRWWFNALHSLDFPWLIYFRPAWDVVVIVLSLGGLLVSLTGVIVGWRRLRTALSRC